MPHSLSFRPLCRGDFPLLERWLRQPHIARWWGQPINASEIDAKYSPRIDSSEPTHVFIIEADARPVGWIQWYRWADYPRHAVQLGAGPDDAGIDLSLGDEEKTGVGIGPQAIRGFLDEVVFADLSICAVVSDPEEKNSRSRRAFAKAGFHEVKTVHLDGETVVRCVVRLNRREFFLAVAASQRETS